MIRPVPKSADSRPRIHVRATSDAVTFRYGATGMAHQAPSIGAAVEAAIACIDGRDAVIFVERGI